MKRLHATATGAMPVPASHGPLGGSDPRIVHVLTRLSVGGAGKHVLACGRDLGASGHRITVISGEVPNGEKELPISGVDHVALPRLKREISPRDDAAVLRELTAFFKATRPDVVHTHMAKAGLLGRVAARRAGVPVIVHTYHGHVLNNYFSAPVSRAFASAEKQLARITDAFVAVSSWVRDDLMMRGVGDLSRWHVIPLGLDQVDLLEKTAERSYARASLGLPVDAPVVGIVGRLAPIKDVDTFLDAAALVLRARPDTHFVIAGDGEERVRLEHRARRLLGGSFSMLGWVEDLRSLYGALDVVVLTSLNEGTPSALIEAAAARRPVVATDVGGVSGVVVDRVTGLLAPRPKQPQAVAERVLELIHDPSMAERMGEFGRTVVEARFSQERTVREIAGLYTELIEKKT